jgi:hypothetical protein
VKRCAFVLSLAFFWTVSVYGEASTERPKSETWYEQALRHINPNNIDYGAIWGERKRAIMDHIGDSCFQYSFVATALIIVLLTLFSVQGLSHKRSLDIAAQSIADVIRHDQYSRRVAHEAIQRYNEHIEACNRAIETKQDSLSKSTSDTDSEWQRIRQELADTRAENKSLRDELSKKQKILAGITPPEREAQGNTAQNEGSSGYLAARIDALEKQLRAEHRKNPHAKGTTVHDHRA